jgi:hypothetical protein
MSSSAAEVRALARSVQVSDDELMVELVDGRRIFAPLVWFPRLLAGSATERAQWEILGDGEGIHWSALDEDLSVAGLLAGNRSRSRPLRRAG